jgi:diguanylate cyclase (GGDEF)-like protein
MPDRTDQEEIARLNKIIQSLMNRAERNASVQGSDFNLFQTGIMLEGQVRRRTEELDDAMRVNEKITRDLREIEKQIRKLAFYDTLTQLANRRLLTDRLGQAMATSKRSDRYGAVMFLDMDNFKTLNDTHGHEMGDLLLIEVAHRLTRCLRETDTVARFGGDEFVVILSELDTDKQRSAAQAGIIAEKIRTTLAEPYLLSHKREDGKENKVEHHCTSSIGAVLFINHEASQEDVLKWADMAMYQAKKSGRNRVNFFAP